MYNPKETFYEVTLVDYDYYSHDERFSMPIVLNEQDMRKRVSETEDTISSVRRLTPEEAQAYHIGLSDGDHKAYLDSVKLRNKICEDVLNLLSNIGRAVESKTDKKTLLDIKYEVDLGPDEHAVTFKSLEELFDRHNYSTFDGNDFVQAFLNGKAMDIAKELDEAKASENTLDEDKALTELREKLVDNNKKEK